ncbi:MAG: AP endonuclease [Spirochaetaceae bacterium]|jgi:sugar phosphate isomerase/epimerase|nr:AP endonuclease [Spirochaetaceae bacterium]
MSLEKLGKKILLATPSWVMPGTYLENLRFLRDKNSIDAVELLFFLYDDGIRTEFLRELPGIRDFAKRFVFTAHLPGSLKEEHEELVGTLSPLVKHFIVHPAADAEAEARFLETWMARYGRQRFLLENTSPGLLEALLACFDGDAPLCMDTAHLLMEGRSPAEFARRYGGQIREVHLNGTGEGGGDSHKAPRAEDGWFLELTPFLRQFSGIVNLELFSWDEVQRGIDCLEENV